MTMTKLRITYHQDGKPTGAITIEEGTQPKGSEFTPIRSESFSYQDLPDTIRQLLTAYGLRALLSDRTSDAKANGVNKFDWMKQVYEQLQAGDWFAKRQGGGGGIDYALVTLVAELKGITPIEAEAALRKVDKAVRDAIAEAHAVRLARIRAERIKAVDADLTDLI
jgi:hypothetical protein